jgi:hypothetical protein
MPRTRSLRRYDDDDPRPRKRARGSGALVVLILIFLVGLPVLAGGGYLVYRLTKLSTPSSEKTKLEKFKKTLTGRWVTTWENGIKASIEFRADGTLRGRGIVNDEAAEVEGRWEAVRVEGDRLIVKVTLEGISTERPYRFVSDDEYQVISPSGRTVTARRSK